MKWTRSLRLGALASACVAAFASVGCIKTDDKTTLAKDGSGTVDVTITIDMSKMKEMKDMFSAMMPQTPPAAEPAMEGEPAMGEPAAPKKEDDGFSSQFSREEVEKDLKKYEGLELKDYKTETTDGKQVVHMVIAFKSWESLCKSGATGNKAITLTKGEDGNYTIVFDAMGGQGPGAGGAGGADAGGADAGAMMEGMLPMLEGFMGGLEFKSAITVPGAIIETNGTKSEDGATVSWSMAWKDITASIKEKKKDGTLMKVTFKGEGIDLKPFSFKPDAEKAGSKMGFGAK